ncbi:hypothetical protein ABIA39_008854 [Nocardia sp. GAS34]|uniref:hypothetical protein n=1 Tax=unclassified Nocardia TaxID=2637762 RepID=UPI003D23ABC3
MPMLPMHHTPLVAAALRIARRWYIGHGNPLTGTTVLAHAVAVANTIGDHAPGVAPEWIVAALLHCVSEVAPSTDVTDLDDLLTGCSPGESEYLMTMLNATAPMTPLIAAAEKAVTLTSVLDQAAAVGREAEYWAEHPELPALIDECRRFHSRAAGMVPATLAELLGALVARAGGACTADTVAPAARVSRKYLEHSGFDVAVGGVAPARRARGGD